MHIGCFLYHRDQYFYMYSVKHQDVVPCFLENWPKIPTCSESCWPPEKTTLLRILGSCVDHSQKPIVGQYNWVPYVCMGYKADGRRFGFTLFLRYHSFLLDKNNRQSSSIPGIFSPWTYTRNMCFWFSLMCLLLNKMKFMLIQTHFQSKGVLRTKHMGGQKLFAHPVVMLSMHYFEKKSFFTVFTVCFMYLTKISSNNFSVLYFW